MRKLSPSLDSLPQYVCWECKKLIQGSHVQTVSDEWLDSGGCGSPPSEAIVHLCSTRCERKYFRRRPVSFLPQYACWECKKLIQGSHVQTVSDEWLDSGGCGSPPSEAIVHLCSTRCERKHFRRSQNRRSQKFFNNNNRR